MQDKLIEWAKRKGLTIAGVESFTGGMFADIITNVPGSSKVFKGSLVAYSNDFKIEVLGIDPEIIKKYSAASIACLTEMLKSAYKLTRADIIFGFTGHAPSTRNDLETLSYVGFILEKKIHIYQFFSKVPLNRVEYKESAIQWLINKFLSKVIEI